MSSSPVRPVGALRLCAGRPSEVTSDTATTGSTFRTAFRTDIPPSLHDRSELHSLPRSLLAEAAVWHQGDPGAAHLSTVELIRPAIGARGDGERQSRRSPRDAGRNRSVNGT